MSTEDAPCPVNFPKTFASGELKDYYAGWTLHKYNEDFGQLHKTDENGNRIKMRFVTMLAQKLGCEQSRSEMERWTRTP